jgi:hypothetical protein
MPRPRPHYRLFVTNLQTNDQLKIELVDLPFATARIFRLRVNGKWARKLPIGSKTPSCGNCAPGGWRINWRRWGIGTGNGSQFVHLASGGQPTNEVPHDRHGSSRGLGRRLGWSSISSILTVPQSAAPASQALRSSTQRGRM